MVSTRLGWIGVHCEAKVSALFFKDVPASLIPTPRLFVSIPEPLNLIDDSTGLSVLENSSPPSQLVNVFNPLNFTPPIEIFISPEKDSIAEPRASSIPPAPFKTSDNASWALLFIAPTTALKLELELNIAFAICSVVAPLVNPIWFSVSSPILVKLFLTLSFKPSRELPICPVISWKLLAIFIAASLYFLLTLSIVDVAFKAPSENPWNKVSDDLSKLSQSNESK